jgi:hypothetical protein
MYGPRAARMVATLERWPLARIRRAQSILDRAYLESRVYGSISGQVIGQALLMVAALAQKRP